MNSLITSNKNVHNTDWKVLFYILFYFPFFPQFISANLLPLRSSDIFIIIYMLFLDITALLYKLHTSYRREKQNRSFSMGEFGQAKSGKSVASILHVCSASLHFGYI
jgi:hypothetical protein